MAWFLVHGELPKLCVLHKCDNPKCVNIDHLFLGTHADNNRDRDLKGRTRYVRGDKITRATITNKQAAQIKARLLRPLKRGDIKALAVEFGTTQQVITKMRHLRAWGWVTPQE